MTQDEINNFAYTEYHDGTDAWRFWAFTNDEVVIAVSYNCKLASEGIETAIVDEIVSSIQL